LRARRLYCEGLIAVAHKRNRSGNEGKHLIVLNNNDFNHASSSLTMPGNKMTSSVGIKKQIGRDLKQYGLDLHSVLKQTCPVLYPIVCGRSVDELWKFLVTKLMPLYQDETKKPLIKFAFVKFTGGFGECLWEPVRTAIYQGRQSDLRQHICIKFYLTSQEAYLIDGAANVYNREYDNQILFMPYQQGLEALRYKEIAISSIPILTPKVVEKVNQNNSASSLVDVSSYSKNKVDMEALWKEVTATIRISRKYYYEVFFVYEKRCGRL